MLGVVRTRSSFWVVLHREDRLRGVLEPSDSAIVAICVAYFKARSCKTVRVNSEAMVLRADIDAFTIGRNNRMISAMVTKLHFESAAAHSQRQDLVP